MASLGAQQLHELMDLAIFGEALLSRGELVLRCCSCWARPENHCLMKASRCALIEAMSPTDLWALASASARLPAMLSRLSAAARNRAGFHLHLLQLASHRLDIGGQRQPLRILLRIGYGLLELSLKAFDLLVEVRDASPYIAPAAHCRFGSAHAVWLFDAVGT